MLLEYIFVNLKCMIYYDILYTHHWMKPREAKAKHEDAFRPYLIDD